jgi:pimeloyl-[acyl-carrier protein] methyl ester esterase
MEKEKKLSWRVVAMHGWASDARCWKSWIEVAAELGWHWQCGERGYGEF